MVASLSSYTAAAASLFSYSPQPADSSESQTSQTDAELNMQT